MKKKILLLTLLIASVSLGAQVQTVITGKVNNKPKKPVVLLVYTFDTVNMRGEEVILRTRINDDNTFLFAINLVNRPFTTCRLGFDNEGQKIIVSPGDSVITEFTCGAMDSTMTFSRSNAGINNYLKEYQLAFNSVREREFYGGINGYDSSLAFRLTVWRDMKLNLLRKADSAAQLDPAFVKLETTRIGCEFFSSLMGGDIRHAVGDSVRGILLKQAVASLNHSDDQALIDLREYRDFIDEFIDFSLTDQTPGYINLQQCLDQAGRELMGLSHTWYCYNMITDRIRGIRSGGDKSLLRNYFIKHTSDERLARLLQFADLGKSFPGGSNSTGILLSAFSYFIAILIIGAFVLLLFLLLTQLKKRGVQVNPLMILIWGILLFCLATAAYYLKDDMYPGNRLAPILRIFTMAVFTGFTALYVIPQWFKKGKYHWFTLFLLMVSAVYGAFLIKAGIAGYRINPSVHWLQHYSIVFIVNSWLFLVLLSFFLHYLILLVRNGKRIPYLFQERIVNLEVVANVLFVAIAFSRVFTLHNRAGSHSDDLLIFIAGTCIFYLQALWLIPRYLINKRVGRYLAATGILLVITFIVFYADDRIGVYRSLHGMGLTIGLFDVVMSPGEALMKTTLALQLFMVPAFIYAYVKIQLKQKSIGFKLFRNKEAELNQLRSQVNPHFLFNSLNTLYAFALKENSAKTAEYIAKLANLMRYLVDDMEKERIPVQKEIGYIRDYINLQAIRSSVEHNIDINIAIEEDQQIMIAPMLMIPFVENAFKHGINPNSVSVLNVTFQIVDGRFQFVIENSVDKSFESFYKERGFGIGIQNVRQRLEHIYPGRHNLTVADTGGRFIVIMAVVVE